MTIRKTFKAESLDDALADARLELGDGIKVIAALCKLELQLRARRMNA